MIERLGIPSHQIDRGVKPRFTPRGAVEQRNHRLADLRDRRLEGFAGEAEPEIGNRVLLQIRERLIDPAPRLARTRADVGVSHPRGAPPPGGKSPVRGFVIQHADGDLPEIVFALGESGRFARGLNRGEQQGDQHADDGDHHQQLNQREAAGVRYVGDSPAHERHRSRRCTKRSGHEKPWIGISSTFNRSKTRGESSRIAKCRIRFAEGGVVGCGFAPGVLTAAPSDHPGLNFRSKLGFVAGGKGDAGGGGAVDFA